MIHRLPERYLAQPKRYSEPYRNFRHFVFFTRPFAAIVHSPKTILNWVFLSPNETKDEFFGKPLE